MALSVTCHHGHLSSCTMSDNNYLILRKLSDRRLDGQVDGNDFIACCLMNAECPLASKIIHKDEEGDCQQKKKYNNE